MSEKTPAKAIPLGSFIGLGAGPSKPAPTPETPPPVTSDAGPAKAEDGDDDGNRTCPSCDETVDDPEADFCPYCGAKLEADDNEDEDGDDEMRSNSPAAQARRRERARCAAILGHAHAKGREEQAAQLAFNTRMSRQEAITVLKAGPKGAPGGAGEAGGLNHRMEGLRGARPGADAPQQSGQKAISDSWDRAGAKAGLKPAK